MVSLPVRKSRDVLSLDITNRYRTTSTNPWNSRRYTAGYNELMITESHPYSLLGETNKDLGGPWKLTRSGIVVVHGVPVSNQYFEGQLLFGGLNPAPSLWSTVGYNSEPSDSVMDADGAKAIALVKPDNPSFTARSAIAEYALEGSPKAIGASLLERTSKAKKAGSEYLNIEFGWKPLIRDVKDLGRTIKNTDSILSQYRRDANRNIRRRLDIPGSSSETRTHFGTASFSGSYPAALTGKGSITETRGDLRWFAGSFRYSVPMGNDVASRFIRYSKYADKLMGLGVASSPDQLWAIAPWAWLTDWFADTSAVVDNITSMGFDGLVMNYGYSMRETFLRRISSGTISLSSGVTGTASETYETLYKKRRPGHPFGFGLTDAGLSARQLAILAALGLTQGHRRP